MLHFLWLGFIVWAALTVFGIALQLVIALVGGVAYGGWAIFERIKGDNKMKLLLKISCWTAALLFPISLLINVAEGTASGYMWLDVIWITLQSVGTLVYIRQHDQQDKLKAKLAEHEALKAELLAEMQA